MDKTKGHHHHGGHHTPGKVPDHHDQTPGQCEERNGSTGNNTSYVDGGRYATVSFQANNNLDIFQVLEVRKDDEEVSDEALIKVKDLQFDSHKPWVTGNVPQIIPVNVEGDTVQVHALFKAECFDKEYKLRIYVEYEEAEVLITESDEPTAQKSKCDLEPKEIHL
jgi:hypothetical protein